MAFEHLNEGTWSEDGVSVSAMRVRHPSFTVGYRLEAEGRSVCYVPDNELVGGAYEVGSGWRKRLVQFCGDTDLLIHDAMFTLEEYPAREGWGHSTYRQTLDLAAEAGVRRLLYFHHAPERSDRALSEIVDRRREEAATRGLSLKVDRRRRGSRARVPVGETIVKHFGSLLATAVGGKNRFDYTALRSTWPLVSSPPTKTYGTLVMVAEPTMRVATPSAYRYRELDLLAAKGKIRPVTVYELVETVNAPRLARRS